MYNMHGKLNSFYNNHVRLGEKRLVLAKYRDANIDRLKIGLGELGFTNRFEHQDQGSYAMFTINQDVTNNFDLDEAIIFSKDDLPETPVDARNRIEAGIRKGGGNFNKSPEAKTNAVRVYYSEGHHIDLAVYRKFTDSYGNEIIEHAGSEWSRRNPEAITNWFNQTVIDKSPLKNAGAFVDENQMRRIVRFVKYFSKSRPDWSTPGGLIISALVDECYVPDYQRDDVSLFQTMSSMFSRLRMQENVWNPVDATQKLTYRERDIQRIRAFKDKLGEAISILNILFNGQCTEKQAYEAWHWMFCHAFWDFSDKDPKPSINVIKRVPPPAPWSKFNE